MTNYFYEKKDTTILAQNTEYTKFKCLVMNKIHENMLFFLQNPKNFYTNYQHLFD